MAGGAAQLPKWQAILLGGIPLICTSRSYRLARMATASQNGRKRAKTAKMAARANLVPNSLPNWHSKYHAK